MSPAARRRDLRPAAHPTLPRWGGVSRARPTGAFVIVVNDFRRCQQVVPLSGPVPCRESAVFGFVVRSMVKVQAALVPAASVNLFIP